MTYIINDRRIIHAPQAELEERPRKTAEAGRTSALRVWQRGSQFHGIWQMEPGVLDDVHGAETVIILHGRASIDVHPAGVTVDVGPGDVFVLDEGERARWTVQETVRKFYVINQDAL